MPTHGPPGDPHKTGGGSAGFGGDSVSPFGSFMDLLIPAIGSALNQVAFHGETLQGVARDYFSPVFGPGAPDRFRQASRDYGKLFNQTFLEPAGNFIADDFSLIGQPNELLLQDVGRQARTGVNFLVNSAKQAVDFARTFPEFLLPRSSSVPREGRYPKRRRTPRPPIANPTPGRAGNFRPPLDRRV